MHKLIRHCLKIIFFTSERVGSFQLFILAMFSFASSFWNYGRNLWNSKHVWWNRSKIGQTFEFTPHIRTNYDLFFRRTFYIGGNHTMAVDRAENVDWVLIGKSLHLITSENFPAQNEWNVRNINLENFQYFVILIIGNTFKYKIKLIIRISIKIWVEWCII